MKRLILRIAIVTLAVAYLATVLPTIANDSRLAYDNENGDINASDIIKVDRYHPPQRTC